MMQLQVKNRAGSAAIKLHWPGMLVWLLGAILALQLLGSAAHDHALAEEHDDCVSCYLAAHLPPDMPSDALQIVSAPAQLHYQILPVPTYFFLAACSFLIPLSQAPPVRPSSL